MSRISIHAAPDKEAIERNKKREPLGEQIRAELIDWINRNGIVSVMLDTYEHCVSVDIVKLPPEIKPALTLWGSIYVRNDPESASPNEPEDVQLDVEGLARAAHENYRLKHPEMRIMPWADISEGARQINRERVELVLALLHRVSAPEVVFEFSPSPCGHSSQYAYTEDGGKNIVCLVCERRVSGKGALNVTLYPQPISVTSGHELLPSPAPVPATPETPHSFEMWIRGYRGIRHINDWLPPEWLELGQDYGDYRAKTTPATTQGTPEGAK